VLCVLIEAYGITDQEEAMRYKERYFRYKEFGEGDPLVIIPGLDGITEFFADIVPELARFYRVIVYYLPLIAEAKREKRDYTFEYIADDLKGILDEIGVKKVSIIGESFGGVCAQVFAHNYHERVNKLILISTAPRFNVSQHNRILAKVFKFVPQWLFARLHVSDVFEKRDPQWAKDLFTREAAWACHPSVDRRVQIVIAADYRSRVREITSPTLLVIGKEDTFTGADSRKMIDQLPDGKLVELPGGHLCHLIHPGRFLAAAYAFLGKGKLPKHKAVK